MASSLELEVLSFILTIRKWKTLLIFYFLAHRLYSFKKDNSSFEYQWSSENKLDTAEELEQNSVQQSDLKDSSESENSAKSDQANLNTSSLKPMPKNEAKPTEPDFFGDRYAMDDFPSQTVSVCLWFLA